MKELYITKDKIPSIPKSKVVLKNVRRTRENIH